MFGLIWSCHGMSTVTRCHGGKGGGVLVYPITEGSPRYSLSNHRRFPTVYCTDLPLPSPKYFWTFKWSCLFIINTVSIGYIIYSTAIPAWVQSPQTFSVCPGLKSRTTRMKSGNWCILLYCMTRNAMKWSFYWGSCKHWRMPSIRFLKLAGSWLFSYCNCLLCFFVDERNKAIFISEKGNFMFLISSEQ